MNKTLYAGIDVSKDKLDIAIVFDPDKIVSFNSFTNDLKGFKGLLKWVKSFKYSNIHFCLEATNIYHESVSEYLMSKRNTIVSIVNPAQTKYFARARLVRTKTDKTDAELISLYACIHKPEASESTVNETNELKELTRYLKKLIDENTQQKNRFKVTRNSKLKGLISRKIDFIENEINEVEKLIKKHTDKYITLKSKKELLMSINGIGERTACILLSEMLMVKGKPVSSKAQTAYAGLDPCHRLSGTSLKGKSRISSTGNARLRKALYMCALSCIRKEGQMSDFYRRLISKGKVKKVALTAVMRKLLVTANGVLTNQTPFQADWANMKQKNIALAS